MIDWQDELMKRQVGAARVNANTGHNVWLILDNDERVKGRFRLNSFKNAIEVKFPRVYRPDAPFAVANWRSIEDTDFTILADFITKRYDGMSPTDATVGKAVAVISRANTYDPLVEYLSALQWDGTKRIDSWLVKYLGVTDTSYARLVGRKYLIAAVARGLSPGAKVDTILIAEGRQGIKKSSAFRALAGPEFFSDTPIDIGSKDGRIALQGVWIMELAELESLRKSESTRVKSFFSQVEDKFRPPYGKVDVVVPRRVVFCGSSNTDSYLVDETGNRRFWPIRCGTIDIEALARDRNQLWAEARVAYEAGEQWWLGTEVQAALAEAEADDRVEDDPWTEVLQQWLTPRQHVPVTREEILVGALEKTMREWDRRLAQRLGIALKRMDWHHVRRRVAGGLKWFYQFGVFGHHTGDAHIAAETRRAAAIKMAKTEKIYRDDPGMAALAVPPKPPPSA